MARLSGNCEENDAVVNNSKSPKAQPNCNVPFNEKHNLSPPHWLPNFLISNVRSITNKIDELSAVVSTNQIDMMCITETWLCSIIPDNALSFANFTVIRNDRTSSSGGGVCIFINNNIYCQRLENFENPSVESLWLLVRPKRLPRSISVIV